MKETGSIARHLSRLEQQTSAKQSPLQKEFPHVYQQWRGNEGRNAIQSAAGTVLFTDSGVSRIFY
jgi:hypothetical protein